MGAQQSKTPASRAHDKAVDRMRKLKIQDAESSSEINEKSGGGLARDAQPLPLDAVSMLPSQILDDPRNRSVHITMTFRSRFY